MLANRPQARTRTERRQELVNLVSTAFGSLKLRKLYQTHFRLNGRYQVPTPQVMIARLLSVEYPDA